MLFSLTSAFPCGVWALPKTFTDANFFKERFIQRVEDSIKEQFIKPEQTGQKKGMLIKNLRELLDNSDKTI